MGRIAAKLAELGIVLPAPMAPIANYVPFVQAGDLVVVSGQVPARDGKIAVTGKVGSDLSAEEGQAAARLCLINVLVHLQAACGGDLDRVVRIVRLGGFVACAPDFTGARRRDERRQRPGCADFRRCRPPCPQHDRRIVSTWRCRRGSRRPFFDRVT